MRLLNKKKLTVIGINSGTSADGIDLSALLFEKKNNQTIIKVIANKAVNFKPELQKKILTVADSYSVSKEELIRLDQALGNAFGRAAKLFINNLIKKNIRTDIIASHGQTICHLPQKKKYSGYNVRGSMQLGSPEEIATICNLPVIADMRQADIASGGEGAPITTNALEKLTAINNESRVIVNIGGIANYFYFPSKKTGKKTEAKDIGPGNVLSDMLCRRLFNKSFDKNGNISKSGTISRPLLLKIDRKIESLLKQNSTGREIFDPSFIDEIIRYSLKNKIANEDIIATVTELTAKRITLSIKKLTRRDKNLSKLYLTGGGAHNRFLVKRINESLGSVTVLPISEIGLDIDFVESASYAVIGYECLQALSRSFNNLKMNRVNSYPVAGRIIQPPVSRQK